DRAGASASRTLVTLLSAVSGGQTLRLWRVGNQRWRRRGGNGGCIRDRSAVAAGDVVCGSSCAAGEAVGAEIAKEGQSQLPARDGDGGCGGAEPVAGFGAAASGQAERKSMAVLEPPVLGEQLEGDGAVGADQ